MSEKCNSENHMNKAFGTFLYRREKERERELSGSYSNFPLRIDLNP